MAQARANGLAVLLVSSAAVAEAKGAVPPKHSTQCQPLPDGWLGAVWFWSRDCWTPSAEHSWCNGASAGLVDTVGAMTAAARDSVHQANANAASARARRS